ncbi:MAG: hypothetical protein SOY35_08305, partial [Blautia sp.]|uniref:hypothetical protein n=1 Tax=Blautia sp. TaxID=1955243 RepID=UPI002A80A83F
IPGYPVSLYNSFFIKLLFLHPDAFATHFSILVVFLVVFKEKSHSLKAKEWLTAGQVRQSRQSPNPPVNRLLWLVADAKIQGKLAF